MRFLSLVQAACAQVVVVTTTATVYHTVHASPSVVGVSGFFNSTTPTSTIRQNASKVQTSAFAETSSSNLSVSYQSPISPGMVPEISSATEIPLFFGPTSYLTDRKHEYQRPGRMLEKSMEDKGEVQGTAVEEIGKLSVTSSGDDEEVPTTPAITPAISAPEPSSTVSTEASTTTETRSGYHEEKRKIQDVIERLLGRGSHNQSKSVETEPTPPTSIPKKTKTHTVFVDVTTTMTALEGSFSENRSDVGSGGTISQPLVSRVSTTGTEAVTTSTKEHEDGGFEAVQPQSSLSIAGTSPGSLEVTTTPTNEENQPGHKKLEGGSKSKTSAATETASASNSGPTVAPSTATPEEIGPSSAASVHSNSSPERPISPEVEITTFTITQTAIESSAMETSATSLVVAPGVDASESAESDLFRMPVETETQKQAKSSDLSFHSGFQNSGIGSITLSSQSSVLSSSSKPTEPVKPSTASTTNEVTKEPISRSSASSISTIINSGAASLPPPSTYSTTNSTNGSTTNSTKRPINSTTNSTTNSTSTFSNSFPISPNASTPNASTTPSNSTNGATTTHPSRPSNSTIPASATALTKRTIRITTQQTIMKDVPPVENYPMRQWSIEITMLNEQGEEITASILDKVTYTLHPTFANPIRTLKQAPFRVEEQGWGEFDIPIAVHLVGLPGKQGERKFSHDLNFLQETYTVDHQISVPLKSAQLNKLLAESGPVPADDGKRKNESDLSSKSKKLKGANGAATKGAVDLEKLANGLTKLSEDDLIVIVQMVTDNRTNEMNIKNDVDNGEFTMDLFTLPESLLKSLWDYVKKHTGEA
ncbi:uncharacterized protein CXQ87_002097 [Candidozyma duobushaemuli]|uniref:YEATS domain-containing protein n=1 Tax=Candidozyma duobushaemuli TaxID=1231522 RepID=A0A2V1A8H9_9ASCO|nr:uncharacterized protein CXQ87_002097 [[Candida] duobushaemulonis]PVH13975.1 hypothetical protein CXQ87_002097 [[Candida] duobushaemulonis]